METFPHKTKRTIPWLLALTDSDLKNFNKVQKNVLLHDCQKYIDSWANVIASTVTEGPSLNKVINDRNSLIALTKKLR